MRPTSLRRRRTPAHELGTPLTPIRLHVHAMKQQARGSLAHSVDILERDVNRLFLLVNDLVNASKFTPAGGTITLRAGRDGDLAWFEVQDTGIGISRPDLARLFHRFSQVHDEKAITAPGTGLGLYICRGIMTAMGGTLDAQSGGHGRGATFRAMMHSA